MTVSESLPLVTIVTPSYNQGHYIEDTILSVLNQDYPNVEYIVVDGGSTDNTIDILRKYDHQLIWFSEPDHGQSHAINKGFKLARGEILAWINSDDKYEQGAISNSVHCLLRHPEIAMTYGRINVISSDGKLIETTPAPRPFDLWAIMYMGYGIDQASTFFRKSALEDVGYVNEKLHWTMDWDLWIRIGSRYNVGTIDAVIASIRMYYGTKTSTGGLKRIAEIVSVVRTASISSLLFSICRASFGMIHMNLKFRHYILYRYLQLPILFFKKSILNKLYSNFQGVFPDGWLGRKARFLLPVAKSVSGYSYNLCFPDDPRLVPNVVTAMINNQQVAKMGIPSTGTYNLRLPRIENATKPVEVVLVFARSLPVNVQGRRLACRLAGVS